MKNSSKKEVRVRIAPSPTGLLHLGTARAALFNYLFAKKEKGQFILRIEDTDLERSDPKYTENIINGLKWLGITWDEGPEIGGDFGPYFQSQRIADYTDYLEKLLKEEKAYYCYCTEEELNLSREEMIKENKPPIYSGLCRNLSKQEKQNFESQGRKPIIRFKTQNKVLEVNDLIRGKLKFDTSLMGDFSLAKDLKSPLYNFAVVVDDFLMKISHVIRGEDHISNTPKQILIQEALALPSSLFAHLPLILGPDRSKLSKRHGATSIDEYRKQGFLPEAMVNFMAFLGWNPKDEREIFSLKELVKEFTLENVGKAGAIFNMEKLEWLNGYYLRKLSTDKLVDYALPYVEKGGLSKENFKKIITLEQGRLKKFSDLKDLTQFFFQDELDFEPSLLIWKKTDKNIVINNLQILKNFLKNLPSSEYKKDNLEIKIKSLIETQKLGVGETLWAFRVSLTGKKGSPSPFDIAEIMGKDMVLKRIKDALEKLSKLD